MGFSKIGAYAAPRQQGWRRRVVLARLLDPNWGHRGTDVGGVVQLIATQAIGQLGYNWLPNWAKMRKNLNECIKK